MTGYTFDEQIVSDLHKDARGFRPNVSWMHGWKTSTPDEKQGIWDELVNELSEEIDREQREQACAALALTERLEKMYELGATSEVQALQWIIEAEEFDDHDLQYGADYFCYHFGLSYSAKNEFKIQQAINEMMVIVV